FGVFIKKEIQDIVKFEEDRRFAGTEDWLLWLQLSARYPFYFNNAVTGCLFHHGDRSVLSFNKNSLIFRVEFLRSKLKSDNIFLQVFGKRGINKAYSHIL